MDGCDAQAMGFVAAANIRAWGVARARTRLRRAPHRHADPFRIRTRRRCCFLKSTLPGQPAINAPRRDELPDCDPFDRRRLGPRHRARGSIVGPVVADQRSDGQWDNAESFMQPRCWRCRCLMLLMRARRKRHSHEPTGSTLSNRRGDDEPLAAVVDAFDDRRSGGGPETNQGAVDEVRFSWQDRLARLAGLPRLHDLRRAGSGQPSVDAGRGKEPTDPATCGRVGHQLLRYRQQLFGRHFRRDRRPCAARFRSPRRDRDRDEGVLRAARGTEPVRVVAQGDPARDRRTACAASAPTTSTCTRSIASTSTRRSRRRSKRSTTSSRPARRATSARRRCIAWQFAKALAVVGAPRLDALRRRCRTIST